VEVKMISEDAWLGGVIGYPVFRVIAAPETSGITRQVREHFASRGKQGQTFYYSKLPIEEVGQVSALAAEGFHVVDVNLTFRLDREPQPRGVARDFRVESWSLAEAAQRPTEQREEVLAVAERSFRYSRFHLDPLFPNAIANRVKRAWVENYFSEKRGHRLFVALHGGVAVGFLAALVSERETASTAIIELIAVAPGHQGRQIGEGLVLAFHQHYRTRCAGLEVGTQAANIHSTRLYERLGFSLIRSQYVLHAHVAAGQAL
jgi:GNAT superfamily N-acetyltransferase